MHISNFISLLLDFDKLESIQFIFNKMISKLKEYKKYKENLKKKIFSPHIVYIRYYSIFLNRFCFHYSVNHNCDLFASFEHFQSIVPESKEINIFLFNELINFFSFIISQKYSFFIYYGEEMKYFNSNYFSNRLYIISDITLMKYLLTLPEVQNELNIEKILLYSNIDSCNNIINILKEEKSQIFDEKLKKEERNLKYINSLFEFLFLIIRDNYSMLNLSFKFGNSFRMKYKDIIFEQLLKKEKTNFENILKNKIIHHILGNKNLIRREDCINLLNHFENYIDMKIIDNFLKENCDEISLSNQLKQFSLKKIIFPLCDIDYIIESEERINATNYLIEFQKDFNLLNTNIIKPLNIQEKLYKKNYEIFFNSNFFDKIIDLYKEIFLNDNCTLFRNIFFFNFSKMLCFYIQVFKGDTLYKDKISKIIEIIDKDKLDENNKKLIQYMKNLIYNENSILNEQKNKNKIKNLKEKYKKKFDKQIKSVINEYSTELEMDKEEDNISLNNEEICIFCRQSLTKDLNNYYGKICYFVRDYFFDILNNKEMISRKKTTRFVTCNHKIHFNCYSKFILKYIDIKTEFVCPLCKKLSNIIICEFNNIEKKYINGLCLDNNNVNEFYVDNEKDSIKNDNFYNEFFLSNIHFFEKYCSKLLKKEILIQDINTDRNNMEVIYKFIINDFDTFIIYYNITTYKKEQIDIWKNILYTIRLLCKYKYINMAEYIISKFTLIYDKIKSFELSFLLNNEISLSSIINEFIFCLFILYDLNEENKEKLKNIFHNYFLLYMILSYFLQHNKNNLNDINNFNNFINSEENKEKIRPIFNLYYLKYKICFLLYNSKEESLNLDFEQSINSLKNNQNIKSLLINNNIKNLLINEKISEIQKLSLVELPENIMEFQSKYMNIGCSYCKQKIPNFYVCLLCGRKICNNKNCVGKVNKNGKKDYSLIDHCKKCSGGNCIFVSINSSEIIYILKRKIIFSNIHLYLNAFGEYIDEKCYYDNYLLNKIEYEKSTQIFIDLTFRKKLPIINSLQN